MENKAEKVIYLTFDDGPSDKVTDKILDILKESNVNATFFLIGNQLKGREDMVKRIFNEGHSIGLHTYTHEYKKIYHSKKAFMDEMITSSNEIEKIVGFHPEIMRFPSGSRKHLNAEFLKTLHEHNLKVYDWNGFISDGINPKASPDQLFREAVKFKDTPSPLILLLHCDYMHKSTCIALPNIIKYYKNNGFTFKTITKDTPELYFPLSKK